MEYRSNATKFNHDDVIDLDHYREAIRERGLAPARSKEEWLTSEWKEIAARIGAGATAHASRLSGESKPKPQSPESMRVAAIGELLQGYRRDKVASSDYYGRMAA